MVEEEFRQYKLDNGLVVALQNTPTQTVSAILRVHQGAFHERDVERGIAHFLEHCLMAAGTQNLSPHELKTRQNQLGYVNATTGVNMTYFETDSLIEELPVSLELLSQAAFFPAFEIGFVERERQRVLRELEGYNNPTNKDIREFREALFRDHPVNIWTGGNTDVVESCTVDDLRDFHSRGYGGLNADLVIVGGLPENIDDLVQQYFGNVPKGTSQRQSFDPLKNLDDKVIIDRDIPIQDGTEEMPRNANIAIGLVTLPETHRDNYAARTLFHVLGDPSGGHSRLYRRLSSELGMTYHIGFNYDNDCNGNSAILDTAVPAHLSEKAIDEIFSEMTRLRQEVIGTEEMDKVRRSKKFGIAKIHETNRGHVSAIYELWDTGRSSDDLLRGYDEVSAEDVRKVAQELLPAGRDEGRYVLMVRKPTNH